MDGDIGISIRDFDESIERAYRSHFPGDPDKSPALLDWRIRANPHGTTRFAIATRGSEVVGMIALIPTRLRNAPGDGRGYQAVDTSVDPSCRGQGLFVKLGSIAQDPAALGGEILWGFPNGNAAPGWYRRLGWTNFGSVPLLMRPLSTRFLLGRINPLLKRIDLPLVIRRKSTGTVYEDAAELSRDFDRLWERVAPSMGIAVDRSGAWMRWRLFDKPQSHYRCVGKKSADGELSAFVASKVTDKHGARLLYVMEALAAPASGAELTRFLAEELFLGLEQGAEAALAWCPKTAPQYNAYRRAGFLPVPRRLTPIEINFGSRALVPEAAAAAAPDAKWYISFLDSDTN